MNTLIKELSALYSKYEDKILINNIPLEMNIIFGEQKLVFDIFAHQQSCPKFDEQIYLDFSSLSSKSYEYLSLTLVEHIFSNVIMHYDKSTHKLTNPHHRPGIEVLISAPSLNQEVQNLVSVHNKLWSEHNPQVNNQHFNSFFESKKNDCPVSEQHSTSQMHLSPTYSYKFFTKERKKEHKHD